MRKLLIPVSCLVALSFSFAPVRADDSEWLTEDQMQKMSITELQSWANKTDKTIKTSRTFKSKPSKVHMEKRLGFHPMLAENSPDVPLRDELHPNTGVRPDGADSSKYPEPHYYDEKPERDWKGGIVDGMGKVVTSPLTGAGHMLNFTGKALNKVLYFLDEAFPWI